MLFRSTGLGKTELVGEIDHIERHGDYLVLHINTLEPVRWKIRGAINYTDLMTLLKAAMKVSIITFLLSPFRAFRQVNHPGDF